MPIVKLDCEKCGGTLTYDPELAAQRIFNCPFCGTPYLETQEINYNQYNTQIEHLHADVVQVNNDQNAQARLQAGDDNLLLKRFNNALKDYEEASKLTPGNYLAWWGQIRAISHDFTANLERKSELENLQKLFKYAMRMAPDRETQQLEEKFQSYINPLMNQNTRNITSAENELSRLRGEQTQLQKEFKLWEGKHYSETPLPEGLFWFSLIAFGICIFLISKGSELAHIGILGAFISGVALLCMIIIRPILNEVSFSKNNIKQKKLSDLSQQLIDVNRKIHDLSQKVAHWST